MVEAASTPEMNMIEDLPVGYFELNREGSIIRANRMAAKLFQSNQEDLLGKMAWDYMPGDEVKQNREAYLELMLNDEEPEAVQRSFYPRNGSMRVYRIYRTLIRDANGLTIGMRQIMLDITESFFAHEEVQRARMWLESVLSSVAEAVIVTDALGFVRYVNEATEQLTGWKSAEMTGKVIEKVLPLLTYQTLDGSPFTARRVLERRCKVLATMLNRDRSEVRVEMSTAPIMDKESGTASGVVTILRPMAFPRVSAAS